MNIFKKIALKLKLIKPKQNWFKKFFKSFRSLFSFKLKSPRVLVAIFTILFLLTTLVTYVLAQRGANPFEDGSNVEIEIFTTIGAQTWLVPDGVNYVEVLVVAGGGGGGSSQSSSGGGGGGGAGGLKYRSSLRVIKGQSINVVVGGGGAPGVQGVSEYGSDGGNSSFGSLVAIGGGGGAKTSGIGRPGGSGGGGGYNGYSTIKYGGSGVEGEGNSGGNTSALSWAGGAGGGGAGGPGGDNKINHGGGDGGPGVSYDITGSPVVYSVGGNGGGNSSMPSPNNTGKGGDAAYAAGIPYAGGSGVVIIKYSISPNIKISTLESGLIGHWSLDKKDYEEGTVNLVPDSDMKNRGDNDYYPVYDSSYQGGVALKNESGNKSSYVLVYFPVAVGEVYTLSTRHYFSPDFNSGLRTAFAYEHLNGKHHNLFGVKKGEWEVESLTFTAETTGTMRVALYMGGAFTEGYVLIDWIQLEKKDHATPFVVGERVDRVVDKSAYENHGTNYGATFTGDRFGKEGGAMNFGRSGNNLSIESPVGKPGFMTASVWYKRDDSVSSASWRTILGHKTGNIHHLISQSSSKTLGIFDGSFRAFQHTPQNNEWEHYAVIYNSGVDASLYVNGQYNSKVSTSLNLSTNPIGMIGNWKAGNYWSGTMDDVRIYNRALSESEIKSLYDTYNPKTTTGSLQKGLVLDMPLKLKYTKSETPGSEIMTNRTPYDNDGQNSGATITSDGASFNGVNSYSIKSIENYLLDSSQTYSGWVRVGSVNAGLKGVLTMHNYAIPSNLGINIINDRFYISIGYADGSREYSSKASSYRVSLNEWAHVVLLYNKTENSVSFYINGNFDNKWFLSKEVNFVPDKLLIGLWSNNYTGYIYNGEISNVLLYNRALSEEEVKTLYDRGRSDAGIIFQEN